MSSTNLKVVDLFELVQMEFTPRELVLAPWLFTQSLNMIYAPAGVGKTHMGLGIAYAVASGGEFLQWKAAKPRKVLYLDGEMPGAALRDRLSAIVLSNDIQAEKGMLRIANPELQAAGMPDLATTAGQAMVESQLRDAELAVVDNLSCLVRGSGRENDAESWLGMQQWILSLRAKGKSVVLIHHSGKNGDQRGTTKKIDILDTVISLRRPADYNPADGAVFEVHFMKSRHTYGETIAPFKAHLLQDSSGKSFWEMKTLELSTFERVVELANQGLSKKDVGEELGIHKSNVTRHWQKGILEGLIQSGNGTTRRLSQELSF